jgi:hypothetical protein
MLCRVGPNVFGGRTRSALGISGVIGIAFLRRVGIGWVETLRFFEAFRYGARIAGLLTHGHDGLLPKEN